MPAVATITVQLTPAGVAMFEQYPFLVQSAKDYYIGKLGQWSDTGALPGMPWLVDATAQFFGDELASAVSITYNAQAEPGMSLSLGTLVLGGYGSTTGPEPPGPPTTVALTIRINDVGGNDPMSLEFIEDNVLGAALASRPPSQGLPNKAWFQARIDESSFGSGVYTVETVMYAQGAVDGMSPTISAITWIAPDTSPVPVNLSYRFTEPARDTSQNRALVRSTLTSALVAYTDPSHPADGWYQEKLDAAGLVWAEVTSVAYAVPNNYGRKIVLGTTDVVAAEGPIVGPNLTAANGYVMFVGPWQKSQLPHGWATVSAQQLGFWDPDGIDVRAPDGSRLVFSLGTNTAGDGHPATSQWSNGAPVAIEVVAKLNGEEVPHRAQLNDPVAPLPNYVGAYTLWVPDLAIVSLTRETPGHWPNRPAMGTELTFTVPNVVRQRYPAIPPIDPACKIVVLGGNYTSSPYYFIRTYTQEEQNAGAKNIVGTDFAVTQRRWNDGTVLAPPLTPVGRLYALPSVQLEAVTEAAAEITPRVINRVPEPGEVQVPHTTRGAQTRIVFQVLAAAGFTPYENQLRVTVDGTMVFDGSSWASGWSGAIAEVGGAGLKVSFARAMPFESAHLTEVRVYNNQAQLSAWTFTWKDETGPELEDAAPDGLYAVRLTFDEPVGPTALVASHYQLRALSPFAAAFAPVAAEEGDAPNEVRVRFAQPLTFGASYTLRVVGVVDRYGNLIQADNAERTFVAEQPDVPDGRRFWLWDFVPELHKRLDRERGDLEKFIRVVQEPTDILLYEIDRFSEVTDPDRAPEGFVDAMLADLGNPFDLTGLTLGQKRKLLSVLLFIYQQKGTTEGLIDAARVLLGLSISVHPLNEGGWMLGVHELGNALTTWLGPETSFQRFAFEVTVTLPEGEDLGDDVRARLVELVHVMRPAHTHFRRLNITEEA